MNHKRHRPKHQRAGCLMCKPHKDERLSKQAAQRPSVRRGQPTAAEIEQEAEDARTQDRPCSGFPRCCVCGTEACETDCDACRDWPCVW